MKLISADDSIVITIIRVSGEQVRIGVDAPMNVLVLRDVLEAKSDVTV